MANRRDRRAEKARIERLKNSQTMTRLEEEKTEQPAPKANAKDSRKSASRLIVERVAVAATLLGGVLAVYSLRPIVTVSNAGSTDDNDIFENRFTVTNNSIFTLKNVYIDCAINQLDVPDGTGTGGLHVKNLHMGGLVNRIEEIPKESEASFPCRIDKAFAIEDDPPIGQSASTADITIMLSFNYPLPWGATIKKYRFVAAGKPGGRPLRWFPQPAK